MVDRGESALEHEAGLESDDIVACETALGRDRQAQGVETPVGQPHHTVHELAGLPCRRGIGAGRVLRDDEVRSPRHGHVEGLVDEAASGSGAPFGPGVLACDGEVLAGRPDGDDGALRDVLVAEV